MTDTAYVRQLRAVREGALREATEAVAKARDEVVEAARSFRAADWMDRDQEECDVDNAMTRLLEAERVESEARAQLEALR